MSLMKHDVILSKVKKLEFCNFINYYTFLYSIIHLIGVVKP